MKRVLVLDANQRSALAVTRSLGMHGVPVLTADETQSSLSGCSRHADHNFTYPSPEQHPESFIEMIARLVRDQEIGVILPMTELTAILLLGHATKFHDAVIPFPDINTVNKTADKCNLMHLAESVNIPTPRTWYAANAASLPCALDELPFPIVIKPGKSWLRLDGQWRRVGVQIAADTASASRILETGQEFQDHPFMLQEFIPGQGQGVFAIYNKGRSHAFFSHRRLREKPPRGGVSVLSESIASDPVATGYASTLLDGTSWHGVAMVEFRVSPDGTPYLMEINTRFWGSLQLAIDAGVDFPWILYQLACDAQPDPVAAYKTGVRLRWLLGDLDSLYLTLRDRSYPGSIKLGAILRFLSPSLTKTRYETGRRGDFGPFWCELRRYIADILN